MSEGRVFTHEDLAADTVDSADVCVIGTGCGGATLGVRLAEAGKRVIYVERGGYYTSKDFDQREANAFAKIDGGRGFDTSEDGSIAMSYGNNVGGASVHYWADSYRTPVDRLELWEREFGLRGHGEKDLAPFWESLEKDHHVQEAGDAYYNRMNRLLKQGAEKLGWEGHPVPQARKPCAQSGYCAQGCAYDFKQSQIVTQIPRSLASGAVIYADTEARELEWSGGRATRLRCRVLDRATGKPTGRAVAISAKAFVVAAGGYGSPVFLLRQGLKKRLPALGEFTACNPSPMVHALFEEEIVIHRNIPAAWGITHFRLAREEGGRYAEGGYMFMANQLQPATFAAILPGQGASHRRIMADFRKLGGTICWVDDVELGRIELDGETPRYHVPTGGENGKRIRDAFAKQARLLLEVGAREVILGDSRDTRVARVDQIDRAVASLDLSPSRVILAAPHPAGGARMGSDPAKSVVGFDHRVHGAENVFVADPSVFPTAPSVDPSLTIMAFSCVAAAHVKAAVA